MLRHARLCAIAVLTVMGASLAGSIAHAQSSVLEDALSAYEAGRVDDAAAGFERALATAGNGPAELATIHLHLGILRASLGDADGARAAFEVALALRPGTEAPSELGPAQLPAFERAQAARTGRTLRVVVATHGRRTVEARVDGAPAGLVDALVVRARLRDGAERSTRIAGTSGAAQLPDAAERAEVVAVDAHGGIVARVPVPLPALPPTAVQTAHRAVHDGTSRAAPIASVTATGTTGASHDDRDGGGFFSTPWPWMVLGVIVTAATVATVLVVTRTDEYVVGPPVVR